MQYKKETMINSHNLIIFCDFDGTVSPIDISDELFKKYGDFNLYQSKLRSGEITITDYWHKLCDYLNEEASIDDIAHFIEQFEIDNYFINFVDFCRKYNIELIILSDGFIEYIKPFFNKFGLNNIKIFANKMKYNPKLSPIFPFASESCKCNCASCKRNIILTDSSPESIIVYVGDGYSDYCAVNHSDIIFAKKNLLTYCNENKIPHYPYKSFFDILNILKKIIDRNNIKKRRQAELLRKQAFEIE